MYARTSRCWLCARRARHVRVRCVRDDRGGGEKGGRGDTCGSDQTSLRAKAPSRRENAGRTGRWRRARDVTAAARRARAAAAADPESACVARGDAYRTRTDGRQLFIATTTTAAALVVAVVPANVTGTLPPPASSVTCPARQTKCVSLVIPVGVH